MSDPSDLVTGEAVVLELRLAKFASRTLAIFIDLLVQWALLMVLSLLATNILVRVDDALAGALGLVMIVTVLLIYPVTLETLTRGRSLGKLALGLRVVREDGGPIRLRQALIRGLLAIVEIWISFGSVALISSLASAKGKRLGDQLAGTVVIRERMPAQGGPIAVMPPPLAGWATGLDLARLPDDLALAARQFLSRAGGMSPQVRDDMGNRLAAAVGAHVTPPPPPGTPTWAYLAAVLAERRRRELARMQPGWGPHPGWGAAPGWGPQGRPGPYAGTPAPQPAYAPPAPPAYAPTPSASAQSPRDDGPFTLPS